MLGGTKNRVALRPGTTINNAYDFGVGRRLPNLPRVRPIGFAANRRVLAVEKLSHDCNLGAGRFQALQQPVAVNDQRGSVGFQDSIHCFFQCQQMRRFFNYHVEVRLILRGQPCKHDHWS